MDRRPTPPPPPPPFYFPPFPPLPAAVFHFPRPADVTVASCKGAGLRFQTAVMDRTVDKHPTHPHLTPLLCFCLSCSALCFPFLCPSIDRWPLLHRGSETCEASQPPRSRLLLHPAAAKETTTKKEKKKRARCAPPAPSPPLTNTWQSITTQQNRADRRRSNAAHLLSSSAMCDADNDR